MAEIASEEGEGDSKDNEGVGGDFGESIRAIRKSENLNIRRCGIFPRINK